MKKIILSTLLLCFISLAFAGPKYDATYKLISKSYTLNADGSMDYRYRKELQLHTKSAFDKYGETLIWYNPDFQTLTINEAYTIRKDGSKVTTPENAFNPSLPASCTDCERFNVIREMVVTHTALEYEATIVLDYTIHSNNFFMKSLYEKINLYEDAPIERYEIEASAPNSLLITEHLGDETKEYTSQQKIISSWTNLKQKPADAYLSPSQLPYLILQTQGNSSSIFEQITQQNAFTITDAAPFKEVVNQLVDGKTTTMQKVIALRNYIANNIHSNQVPLSYLNYVVASPATVWGSNCGTELEKNRLLQVLLNAINIPSDLGLVLTATSPEPTSMLRLTIEGIDYYLSADNKGHISLEVDKPFGQFISLTNKNQRTFEVSSFKNDVQANIHIGLNNGKPEAEVIMNRNSIESPRNKYLIPQALKPCGTTLQSIGNGYHQLIVSDNKYGNPIQAAYLNRNRTLPVFTSPSNESYVTQITLPSGARWITQASRIEHKYDKGSVVIDIAVDGQVLTLTRRLIIEESTITPKQYKAFRALIADWNVAPRLIFSTK